MTLLDRFMANVSPEPNTGCWIWAASVFKDTGYGQFWDGAVSAAGNAVPTTAHAVSYKLFKGPIPLGFDVRHSCHNRICCNPDHLSLGTRQDNMDDMVKAGRSSRGSARPLSKLSESQVPEIRRMSAAGVKDAEVARAFCVSVSTIARIRTGSGWKHVE